MTSPILPPGSPPQASPQLVDVAAAKHSIHSAANANNGIECWTLSGGVSEGVQVVSLSAGGTRVDVLVTRGLGLWRAFRGGLRFGWDSPVEHPVHPQWVNLESRHGLGWLEGFNELLCRCGLAHNGPPGEDGDNPSPVTSASTLHGRIANLPAHNVETGADEDAVWLQGDVCEAALFGPRLNLRTRISVSHRDGTITVEDLVENRAGTPAEFQLLYHINVGTPVLEAGARFMAPAQIVVPRDPRAAEGAASWPDMLAPTAGYAEQVYYLQMAHAAGTQPSVLLRSAHGTLGFGLTYDSSVLPCFALWKNTQAAADGYCVGLEPGTNFPNPKAYERRQGRVPTLAPGDRQTARLTLSLLESAAAVERFEQTNHLAAAPVCPAATAPQPGWSPAGE